MVALEEKLLNYIALKLYQKISNLLKILEFTTTEGQWGASSGERNVMLRESFKELKKRFSNLRFNYLKRNDRTRNTKAARNQLQQVELYEEKLQALRKRLGGGDLTSGVRVPVSGAMTPDRPSLASGSSPQSAAARRPCPSCIDSLRSSFGRRSPQQEERISQITELAVRLHGVEEGRRYTEKTVGKHSEMVESIRALSDGLLALEARLREASDMHELKETGHTPELTAEHDGKEVPVKRQIAANRKPPLRKSCSLDAERQTESRATSSYCSTHTFNFRCSPLDTNRRVHNIHNQSQPAATEATPSPSVTGPSFSDIQREFGKDASRGSLSEAELHDVMMEDSLSNDEYDCASPDDMSLPPLAETPESIMIQSDVEEGYCFSSHSVHTNQYSRQSEGSGTVRQHRQSSRTDSCPTPPTSRHSSSRFRSESSSFVQSPLTVPAATLFTSTLCSILKTKKTSTANVCLGGPEPSFPSVSNPLDKGNSSDSCSKKDNEVPDKRSPSKTEPVLKQH
ncbi:hypothetical protein KUCAC02_037287, partial [Chaenocephalus aceratus]